jgi:hypothetical protein
MMTDLNLLFGSAATVQATIKHLHKLRYAEANDWSEPMPTGRPNEVMAVLTKRVRMVERLSVKDRRC